VTSCVLIFSGSRSLTKRQRQLLEEYAADVEKRPSASQQTDQPKEPLNTDNGKVYFNSDTPSLGTWLSQGWQMLRDRLRS
jgi:hypothetical protein